MNFLLVLLVMLGVAGPVWAQPSPNHPASSSCKTVTVNAQGTGNVDVTVDNTAAGVLVMAASTTRCGAVIKNTSSNTMRCAPSALTVTSTVGTEITAGEVLNLSLEGQQAWRCIRTGGSNATANVTEATQ